MLFETFRRQATDLIKKINDSKKDTRTEFLCLILDAILAGPDKLKFVFPTVKESFYVIGLEAGGFKAEKPGAKTTNKVQTLRSYLDYALNDMEELDPWEENALYLMEQMLLLYKWEKLCPTTVKEEFIAANKGKVNEKMN